jgi:hypothetical protein
MVSQPKAKSINDLLGTHALCQVQQRLRKQQVFNAFPHYVNDKTFNKWHLSLYQFATIKPLIYINHNSLQIAHAFFSQYADLTVQALVDSDLHTQISHGVFSLLRPSNSWNNEKTLELGKPEKIFDFENVWHPEYQRYCEHVFNHLIRIPLSVLGTLKNKNYQNPALSTRVDILDANGLSILAEGFNAIIRNAISHGSITFNQFNIIYTDNGSTETLTASSFSLLFDSLVDTCHAILVALLLFICDHQTLIITAGLRNLPLGLRFIFIDAFASHEGTQLLSMIESVVLQNKRQLNIVCKIATRSRNVQMLEALNICWTICSFGGDTYDRFGVSFQCMTLSNPFIFIDGLRLREAINKDAIVDSNLSSVIENDRLWFTVPKIAEKFYIWKNMVIPQWEYSKNQLIQELENFGIKLSLTRYSIREIENRSAPSFRRILAHVVLRQEELSLQEYSNLAKSVVNRLHNYTVRVSNLERERGMPGCPHYIAIRLYAHDKRIRALTSIGWSDKNLILMAEWFSKLKNNGPIFVKHPDLVTDGIRIQYNPQFYRTTQQALITLLEERIKTVQNG